MTASLSKPYKIKLFCWTGWHLGLPRRAPSAVPFCHDVAGGFALIYFLLFDAIFFVFLHTLYVFFGIRRAKTERTEPDFACHNKSRYTDGSSGFFPSEIIFLITALLFLWFLGWKSPPPLSCWCEIYCLSERKQQQIGLHVTVADTCSATVAPVLGGGGVR